MKKYTGTKTVKAEPMTMAVAYYNNLLKKGVAPKDDERDLPGYHVVYEDGYESWTPADVFEKTYKSTETFVDRINIELSDLIYKRDKLFDFINSDKYKNLNESVRALMLIQYNSMCSYAISLDYRKGAMLLDNPGVYNISFSEAIYLLYNGFAVRRELWDEGTFVAKQIPARISESVIPNMQSLPQSVKNIIANRSYYKTIAYNNQMLMVDVCGNADSWFPSASDIFANDWELYISERNEKRISE